MDFFAYLNKCRNLLSMRRLRKCLRFGGIIWRLALLFLNMDDVISDAPSSEALNEPQILVEGPEDLVDDGVSMQELELLIGAFHVPNHKFLFAHKYSVTDMNNCKAEDKDHPMQFSYWPPHCIWTREGYNICAWTPDNEDWFVGRFKSYASGTSEVHKVKRWTNIVNGSKDSITMMEALETRARNFLAV